MNAKCRATHSAHAGKSHSLLPHPLSASPHLAPRSFCWNTGLENSPSPGGIQPFKGLCWHRNTPCSIKQDDSTCSRVFPKAPGKEGDGNVVHVLWLSPLSPHPFVLSILKISGQRLGGICESRRSCFPLMVSWEWSSRTLEQ